MSRLHDATLQNSTKQASLPSQRTIAFAICIVSSKPKELTVTGYINLLRQHVAKGRRENTISSVYRHLDVSSFWRSESQRLRKAVESAEDEATDLKREIEVLKSKLATAKVAAPAKKRKRVDGDVIPVARSPKMSRTGVPPTAPSSMTEEEGDFDFSSAGESGTGEILMRSLFEVQYLLKTKPRNERPDLASHLIRAASVLPQIFSLAITQSISKIDAANPTRASLKASLTAVGRVVALITTATRRLSHANETEELHGPVVYAFVHMYANLLSGLDEASDMVVQTMAPRTMVALERPKSAKAKSKPKVPGVKDHPVLDDLTSFLCGVIDLLDPKVKLHTALFEGLAFTVIERIGSSLFALVFKHAHGATIEEETALSDETPPTTAAQKHALAAARLQAPYLIHLLSRIMSASPAHLGSTRKVQAGTGRKGPKTSIKGVLAITAMERLQRTLVNCTFGTEGVDVDDPFMDCLKMPGPSLQPLPMPNVKEAEVQDWFKEEVWRLLGWEILSREDGW